MATRPRSPPRGALKHAGGQRAPYSRSPPSPDSPLRDVQPRAASSRLRRIRSRGAAWPPHRIGLCPTTCLAQPAPAGGKGGWAGGGDRRSGVGGRPWEAAGRGSTGWPFDSSGEWERETHAEAHERARCSHPHPTHPTIRTRTHYQLPASITSASHPGPLPLPTSLLLPSSATHHRAPPSSANGPDAALKRCLPGRERGPARACGGPAR